MAQLDIQKLQEQLCRQMCESVQLIEHENNQLMVSTPFTFPDGDTYAIYLSIEDSNQIRISDGANTMMRLSYDDPDVDKYFQGPRGDLMQQIITQYDLDENDGNFSTIVPIGQLSEGIFRLSQGLNRVYDLSFLNKDRVKNTFYNDLGESLNNIFSSDRLTADYVCPTLDAGGDYPIDYRVAPKNSHKDLFIFGIGSTDKAKLVTIILEHLLRHEIACQTLVIWNQHEEIGTKADRKRLTNVADSQISSLEDIASCERKILKMAG